MQVNARPGRIITSVFKHDGKLYGKSDFDGKGLNMYNLQRTPESILEYDFRNVTEGRELIQQYLPMEDKDES